MAVPKTPGSRKPRIRKTAPTVRQRMEAAREKTEKKPSKLRSVAVKLPVPKVRLHLPNNKVFSVIRRIFGFIARIAKWLVPKYFVNSWREVRQVSWPARKETWRLTAAVFVFAVVFGALVAGVDKGLDEIFKKLVIK